jgi:hypothetical protein
MWSYSLCQIKELVTNWSCRIGPKGWLSRRRWSDIHHECCVAACLLLIGVSFGVACELVYFACGERHGLGLVAWGGIAILRGDSRLPGSEVAVGKAE